MPTGLSHDEAMSIISQMNEKYCLMFSLLYVCGIRKPGLLKPRVKDIDFAAKSVFIYFYEPMPASSGWLRLSLYFFQDLVAVAIAHGQLLYGVNYVFCPSFSPDCALLL